MWNEPISAQIQNLSITLAFAIDERAAKLRLRPGDHLWSDLGLTRCRVQSWSSDWRSQALYCLAVDFKQIRSPTSFGALTG